MLQRGLLRHGGPCGVEGSANKARTLAQTSLRLLLAAALPGRNCHPCFTDEQMGPKRGIHWAAVSKHVAELWFARMPTLNPELCLSPCAATEPRHVCGLRLCFGSLSPVKIDQFPHDRPQIPLSSQPQAHFQYLPGFSRGQPGWLACAPPGPRNKSSLCGKGQVWVLPTHVSRPVYEAPAQKEARSRNAGCS